MHCLEPVDGVCKDAYSRRKNHDDGTFDKSVDGDVKEGTGEDDGEKEGLADVGCSDAP